MKQWFLVMLFMSLAQTANAKFINKFSGEELIAKPYGNNICIAKKNVEGELELLTPFAIEKGESRKAMRSTTYLNRALISFGIYEVARRLVPSLVISYPVSLVLFNAAISQTYDDHSHFGYSFIPPAIYQILLNTIGDYVLLPGLGERIMRGVRIDNLLSEKPYLINNRRFEKVLKIAPTLKLTNEACDLSDFSR